MLESSEVSELSVFFPFVNEEGNVEDRVKKAIVVLEKLKIKYEILLINDGSTDKTGQIIDELAGKNPKIRAIHHKQNLGYGEALKSGFYNAKYSYIVYTDGDGQFDFSEVSKFLESIKNNDVVIGYRLKRQDPFFRILFKQGWKASLFAFFRLTIRDIDCGFKMIKSSVLEKIPHLESSRGAMINAEIVIKAKKAGFKIGQVGVNHYPRLSGKPTGANIRVIIKSFMDLFKLWWKLKDQKPVFIILILMIILAAFLRIYKIDQYMTFLGDEGRDALVVQDMLYKHHFPLIGPPTSIGNIYLGPLYYYMMFVPMVLTNLNPVSAALMNAFIGIATVFFIYYLGKVWFGKAEGLIAGYLYAISPVTIIYSRSSWNPNPTPFFALLCIFSLYRLNKSGNFKWLILTGFSIAAAMQMHYLALILIPTAGILYAHELLFRQVRKIPCKSLFSGTILGIVTFFLSLSPLFLFDLKHNFLNYKAITQLFVKGSDIGFNPLINFEKIPQLFGYNLIGRYLAGESIFLEVLLSLLIIYVFYQFINKWFFKKHEQWPYLALFIWIFVGLIGLSFLKQNVYDHYLGFLNPSVFLLIGGFPPLIKVKDNKKLILVSLTVVILAILTFVNLKKNPLLFAPNNQLKKTQDAAKFIIAQSDGNPFNFALLSKNNYDAAYIFYLGQFGYQPKKLPFEKTSQLFAICEDPVCNVVYSPKYEIAAFGWITIKKEWQFEGVKIYKLVHNPAQPL